MSTFEDHGHLPPAAQLSVLEQVARGCLVASREYGFAASAVQKGSEVQRPYVDSSEDH